MVYSLRARLEVTSEILLYDGVRHASVTWIVQSGLHKLVTEMGINL